MPPDVPRARDHEALAVGQPSQHCRRTVEQQLDRHCVAHALGDGISYLPKRIFETLTLTGQLQIIKTTPAIPRIPYVLMYRKGTADDFLRFVTSAATDTCDFTRMLPGYFSVRTP